MKKTELYNKAMLAVIDSGHLMPQEKLEVLHELMSAYRTEKWREEPGRTTVYDDLIARRKELKEGAAE